MIVRGGVLGSHIISRVRSVVEARYNLQEMRLGRIGAQDRACTIFKKRCFELVFVTSHEAITFSLTEVWTTNKQRQASQTVRLNSLRNRIRFMLMNRRLTLWPFAAAY